jgi:ribosomal protein S8
MVKYLEHFLGEIKRISLNKGVKVKYRKEEKIENILKFLLNEGLIRAYNKLESKIIVYLRYKTYISELGKGIMIKDIKYKNKGIKVNEIQLKFKLNKRIMITTNMGIESIENIRNKGKGGKILFIYKE